MTSILSLRWLNDHDLSQNPELESPVKAVVVMYCKACWKATQVQPELNQFRTYMDTLNSLARKENDQVGMQLLNKLADLKLIEPPTPEILLGTERSAVNTLTLLFARQLEPIAKRSTRCLRM
jgi:hypothetical protein